MKNKKLNTAQALLSHIALKIDSIPFCGATVLVRQWTASERMQYMDFITKSDVDNEDEVSIARPQVIIFALSLVNDKNKPLFEAEWKDNNPTFSDEDTVTIESLLQNKTGETSRAFIAVSELNGLYFGDPKEEEETEDISVKN